MFSLNVRRALSCTIRDPAWPLIAAAAVMSLPAGTSQHQLHALVIHVIYVNVPGLGLVHSRSLLHYSILYWCQHHEIKIST